MATKALTHIEEGKRIEKSLEKALKSVIGLEKEVSSLKDEIVAASDQYFEMAREHMEFFYPNLDLSQMDLFQVVRDGRLVDDEKFTIFWHVFIIYPFLSYLSSFTVFECYSCFVWSSFLLGIFSHFILRWRWLVKREPQSPWLERRRWLRFFVRVMLFTGIFSKKSRVLVHLMN